MSTIRLPKVQHQTIKVLSCAAEDVSLLVKWKDTNCVPQWHMGAHLGHLGVSEPSEGIVG